MLNKVMLQGRLTKDPEMRYTTTGTAVINTTLAVDRSYVKQGEERKADFIRVTLFGKTAEFFGKYFKKGAMVVIVGRIQTDSYDGDDGKKVYITNIVADEVNFCGKKEDSAEPKTEASDYGESDYDPLMSAAALMNDTYYDDPF